MMLSLGHVRCIAKSPQLQMLQELFIYTYRYECIPPTYMDRFISEDSMHVLTHYQSHSLLGMLHSINLARSTAAARVGT